MVFSKLLDNLTGLLTSNDNKEPSIKKSNQKLINELSQGMVLLNNRKERIDKLKNRMKLIENLSGFSKGEQNLTDTTRKELELLEQLEVDYNRKLNAYATNYKQFMTEYHKGVDSVKNCKANCMKNIPRSGQWQNKRLACEAGCDLKGPYVQPCQDTFKKSRIGGQTCSSATNNRCYAGNVLLGMNNIVTSNNYADSNNKTIKDGCCECGGGAGGPPSTVIRGKKIKKCSYIPSAFGLTTDAGNYMVTACETARIENENENRNLHQKYAILANQNEDLIASAKLIFDKINELNNVDANIHSTLDEKDIELKNQLAEYGTLYADIIKNQGKKDQTLDGQLEDVRYKEDSQQLQLWIWTGLAILTILFAIQRMRK